MMNKLSIPYVLVASWKGNVVVDIERNQFVTNVTRDVLTQIAPEELPVFEETNQAYFEDRDRLLKSSSGKDERLGFGVPEIGAILSLHAVLMYAVEAAITSVTERTVEGTIEEVGETRGVKKLIGKITHHKHKEEKKVSLPFSQKQLREMSRVVQTEAKALAPSLSDDQVKHLTDAVVARLALGTHER